MTHEKHPMYSTKIPRAMHPARDVLPQYIIIHYNRLEIIAKFIIDPNISEYITIVLYDLILSCILVYFGLN